MTKVRPPWEEILARYERSESRGLCCQCGWFFYGGELGDVREHWEWGHFDKFPRAKGLSKLMWLWPKRPLPPRPDTLHRGEYFVFECPKHGDEEYGKLCSKAYSYTMEDYEDDDFPGPIDPVELARSLFIKKPSWKVRWVEQRKLKTGDWRKIADWISDVRAEEEERLHNWLAVGCSTLIALCAVGIIGFLTWVIFRILGH